MIDVSNQIAVKYDLNWEKVACFAEYAWSLRHLQIAQITQVIQLQSSSLVICARALIASLVSSICTNWSV